MYKADDWAYAGTRLTGTYVIYKATQLVRVLDVRRSAVHIAHSDGTDTTCKLSDLSVQDFRLGFVNSGIGVRYVSRMPMRRDWRQGLRSSNVRSSCGNTVRVSDLADTLLGKFPSLAECLKKVNGVHSIAWHRHWAVNSGLDLLFKDFENPVGKVVKGEPVLDERYQYLAEYLEESL